MGRLPVQATNILASWFEYREAVHSMPRAECLRWLNEEYGTKYRNADAHRWLTESRTLPERIREAINQDLPELLAYVFEKNDISRNGVNFEAPSEQLKQPISRQ